MSALPQLAQRDHFEDLAVVRERNFIAATPYVNRFGVLVMRKVELDSNAGTLTIRGKITEGKEAGPGGSVSPLALPLDAPFRSWLAW